MSASPQCKKVVDICNIFRIFIGGIADGLLEDGAMDRGITCVETFDYDVVDKIYKPYDNLGLSVILHGDGTREYKVLGSLAEAVKAQSSDPAAVESAERDFYQPFFAIGIFYDHRKGIRTAESRRNMVSFCGG